MNISKKLIAQNVVVGLVVAVLVLALEYIYGATSGNFIVRGIGIGIICGVASVTFFSMRTKKIQ